MATILVFNSKFERVQAGKTSPLLEQIKRIEKRVFPKNEAMDFDSELKKRNTELVVVLGATDSDMQGKERPVAAYLMIARSHGIALLHKVCVIERCRYSGIARRMLSDLVARLRKQGCEKVQLWVDCQREPATRLYQSLGFKEAERSTDYYGPGRSGLKMILEMSAGA